MAAPTFELSSGRRIRPVCSGCAFGNWTGGDIILVLNDSGSDGVVCPIAPHR